MWPWANNFTSLCLHFIIYKVSGLSFTTKSLPALKSGATTSRRANTMHAANCFIEVLKTTKNYKDQTFQINSGPTLLVSGAQSTDSLLELHCFSFTGHSNLWISSGVWEAEQVIYSFTEGTKTSGLNAVFQVSQSVNDKVYLTSLL